MIKNLAIVSLSRGIIGEPFMRFEIEIGIRRLEELGLNVKFMPNAMKGLEYIEKHPEKRAEDLLAAFRDPEIDMILCAIGGDDTYRLLPYLFENNELAEAVCDKVFLGFSDTTINHLMLHKVGIRTFYGQSFLADICELSTEMIPYTRKYFEELIRTGRISEVTPSDTWYEQRTHFTPDQVGVPLVSHPDQGFELLQGSPVFSGKILGGCIDSMYDIFDGGRYADMPVLCEKYGLFPDAEDWKGRILLLESSEEKPSPEKYRKTLEFLKERGVFDAAAGVLAGKPMDGTYKEEYKQALVEVIDNPDLPVVFNLNIGHAVPRCIIPFGVPATVDAQEQVIRFEWEKDRRFSVYRRSAKEGEPDHSPLPHDAPHREGPKTPEGMREWASWYAFNKKDDGTFEAELDEAWWWGGGHNDGGTIRREIPEEWFELPYDDFLERVVTLSAAAHYGFTPEILKGREGLKEFFGY